MKKFFLLLISLSHALPLLAEEKGLYVKGGLSYSFPDDQPETNFGQSTWHFHNGVGFHLALGRKYSDKVAFELEAQHKEFDFEKATYTVADDVQYDGSLTYETYFVNAYYYPVIEAKNRYWRPYFGAGLGVAEAGWNNVKNTSSDSYTDSDSVTAFQVMLGNRIEIRSGLFLDAEYRYFQTSDYVVDVTALGKFVDSQHHSAMFSLVKEF